LAGKARPEAAAGAGDGKEGGVSVRQLLAKSLGITVGRVSQLVKMGCPVDSLENAQTWFRFNVKRKPKKEKIHRQRRGGRSGCVYLLMEEAGSPLKIGFSLENPNSRQI
jgi:hypothetical protein